MDNKRNERLSEKECGESYTSKGTLMRIANDVLMLAFAFLKFNVYGSGISLYLPVETNFEFTLFSTFEANCHFQLRYC